MSDFVQIVHDGVGQYGRGEVVRKELLGDVDRLLGLGAVREITIPVQAGPAQEFAGENQQASDASDPPAPSSSRRRARATEDPNANVPSPSENPNAAAAAEQAIAQAVAAAQDAALVNTGQSETTDDVPPLPTPESPVPVEEAIEAAPQWQEKLDQEGASGTTEKAHE